MRSVNYDSGIYLLEIYLQKRMEVDIGARGNFSFPAGYYYYCGSAQRNLAARVQRHYRRSTGKKMHWHIDYFLAETELQAHFTWQLEAEAECQLAAYLEQNLQGDIIVTGFGASDCKCSAHLFYFQDRLSPEDIAGFHFRSKTGSDVDGK
ncbi:MAG: GIY-YIG nuclease family protein [Halanaerobiales bacterium]